jgi:ketosteroid isomerase-like protein
MKLPLKPAMVAIALMCSMGSGVAWPDIAASVQPASDQQLIRDARARSNASIAAHDVAGIARHWMPDIHIVTSTSAQASGLEPNQQRMAQQFKNRPDTIYVRQPAAVEVFAAWNVASERGDWTGRWSEPDGALEIAGTYLAQWRKVDGQWLIQAELFVPTRCKGGAYCRQHP